MRLILTCLAVANVRWARAEVARSTRLSDEADAALAKANARFTLAQRLADRANAFA